MNETSVKNDIYEKLNNKELTSKLEDIIENNSIPHTTNKNGTFINISVLEKEHLCAIYEYLMNVMDHHGIADKEPVDTNYPRHDFLEPKEDTKQSKTLQTQTIKLTALQQKIISFSL